MPYNALGRSQYPALLADINRSDVAFSVFDGDLKPAATVPARIRSTSRRSTTSTRSSGR
jgi:hypothetical protein